MTQPGTPTRSSGPAEPTWEVAYLFPTQGNWSEDDYLALRGNQLIEFAEGFVEVLPMPTTSHQLLVVYLYGLLLAFTRPRGLGTPLVAPLRVRLWPEKFREPDLVFMRAEHEDRMGEDYWTGADLVMEVVSGGAEDRRRDLVTKRGEYARAGIPEYWIIDPQEERVTVLRLAGKRYLVHGAFAKGETATSPALSGFTAEVSEIFAQQARPRPAAKRAGTGKRPPRR